MTDRTVAEIKQELELAKQRDALAALTSKNFGIYRHLETGRYTFEFENIGNDRNHTQVPATKEYWTLAGYVSGAVDKGKKNAAATLKFENETEFTADALMDAVALEPYIKLVKIS